MASTKYPALNDAAWLRERYVGQGMATTAIAAELGCAWTIVRRALERHQIPLRPPGRKRLNVNVGDRYGRLVVLAKAETLEAPGRQQARWLVRCDCGTEKTVAGASMVSGVVVGCGCVQRERATRHGHTAGGAHSPTYTTWRAMRQRCSDPDHRNFKHYGGRGITVCDRWLHSFENFLSDMGERPAGHTIDRIYVDGIYEPSNCRWATSSEQQAHRRGSVRP